MYPKETKDHFTTGEVAKFCGVTLRTVINWIKAGRLDAYQLPGTRGDNRIRRQQLLAFMQQNQLPIPNELLENSNEIKAKPMALVVDDDLNMAKSIQRVLHKSGFATHYAADGFDAGLMFSEYSPKLLTLDLQMPRFDGFSVLEKLKDDDTCFICVISGMGQQHLDRAVSMRANAALQKPFENLELEKIVKPLIK